jgi:hypothetical protein
VFELWFSVVLTSRGQAEFEPRVVFVDRLNTVLQAYSRASKNTVWDGVEPVSAHESLTQEFEPDSAIRA